MIEINGQDSPAFDEVMEVLKRHPDFEYVQIDDDSILLVPGLEIYPSRREMTVLEFTEKCFVFLRDTVRTGSHGLVRLLNSDWNDAVYYIEKVPYNNIFSRGSPI